MKKALSPFKDSLQQVLYSADTSQISNYEIPMPHYSGSITKKFYQALINSKAQPANLSRWANILNIGNTEELRRTVFRRKVVDIKDNKIREFNFKVLLNILACNNLLSKFKENVNVNCELCQEKDDINHLLINCSLAKSVC